MTAPNIYNYDKSGVYINTGRADPSPKEKDVWLVPAQATLEQIPQPEAGKWPVFSEGVWTLVEDHRGETWWSSHTESVVIQDAGLAAISGLFSTQPEKPSETLEEATIRVSSEVVAHALILKIGVVNSTKTDGGPDYPTTHAALAEIRQQYTEIVTETYAKQLLGQSVTDEEKATVALIQAGKAAFNSIDMVASTIIAAGDVADPIASDQRWSF